MSIPILQMSGIKKRFPGVVALDRVDLEVYLGEIVALAGENGAGKSTLMNILGGIYQPDSGYLRIDDAEIVLNSVSDAIDRGIGFIHQELNVLDNLDVAENVFLGREPVWAGPLRLVDRQKIHVQADLYLKRLGLNISSRMPVKGLSIAHQQNRDCSTVRSCQGAEGARGEHYLHYASVGGDQEPCRSSGGSSRWA